MKRCTYPDCGGVLLGEPDDDVRAGFRRVKRMELVCIWCGRIDGPPEAPLPLTAKRFLSGVGRR